MVTYQSEKFWLWRNSQVTVRPYVRTSVHPYIRTSVRPHRLCGRGRGVPRQPDGGRECHLFLAGNRAVLLGNRRFSWREIAWPSSLWKRGFFKGLSFFSKTIVREYWSTWQKKSNIYKWKEKVQNNTDRRRKVQVTKAAFKGLYRFVFFTAESLPCSERQPSKWSF